MIAAFGLSNKFEKHNMILLSSINDFKKTEFTSVCGWKGVANYYSVVVNGKTNTYCAWYYAQPNDAAMKIKGMISFWNGLQVIE